MATLDHWLTGVLQDEKSVAHQAADLAAEQAAAAHLQTLQLHSPTHGVVADDVPQRCRVCAPPEAYPCRWCAPCRRCLLEPAWVPS